MQAITKLATVKFTLFFLRNIFFIFTCICNSKVYYVRYNIFDAIYLSVYLSIFLSLPCHLFYPPSLPPSLPLPHSAHFLTERDHHHPQRTEKLWLLDSRSAPLLSRKFPLFHRNETRLGGRRATPSPARFAAPANASFTATFSKRSWAFFCQGRGDRNDKRRNVWRLRSR